MRFLHMATRLASTHQGGLVCSPRRPPDARDQHLAGSSPQRHRPEALHDEGLRAIRWLKENFDSRVNRKTYIL